MKRFEFENRKMRSPYTVPPGFFNQMEERLMARVAQESVKKTPRFTLSPFRIAAAAAVVALVVGSGTLLKRQAINSDSYDDIAQCFEQLSAEDQYSMLESYQDDIFIND